MLLSRWQHTLRLEKMLPIYLLVLTQCICMATADTGIDEVDSSVFQIEGKLFAPEPHLQSSKEWQRQTTVSINNGEYSGYLTNDGSFVISGVPAGSYVVEFINPDYYYESVRVEINGRGKFRARKLNYVQPSQVVQVPYPLRLKASSRFKYFQTREQWKITDLVFSPMILMMVLPLILMIILPKMMNDPETKKEMESMSLNKLSSDMPEFSEVLTSFFTGGSKPAPRKDDKPKSIATKQTKKQRNF